MTQEQIDKLNKKLKEDKEKLQYTIPSSSLGEVINDLLSRERIGVSKYNTTIDRTDYDLKQWMQHHYEELLDAALYVKKQIQILNKTN